jgi:hypothetical protein
MPARQLYNDYDFSAAGRAQWGESVRIENSSGGRPRRKITTHRVVVWFLESSFSDNMARYRDLKAALETPEGIFRVTDETGRDVVPAQRVKPRISRRFRCNLRACRKSRGPRSSMR